PDNIKSPVEFGLTKDYAHIKIPPHPALQVRGGRLQVFPRNDLTAGVIQGFPEVGRVLKQLESCGSSIVMMTGSGPTCFGVFEKGEAAYAAGLVMEQMGWRSWVVRCLGRSPYSM
ncbi:MAG: hypothetical protein HZA19_02915, partial [Nitrospirae bacterium]|nr:hypothetical protein [Nitrospirota bacterium]